MRITSETLRPFGLCPPLSRLPVDVDDDPEHPSSRPTETTRSRIAVLAARRLLVRHSQYEGDGGRRN